MGIPHKAFDFKRIVFFCLILVALSVSFLASFKALAAENPLFTVEGITVDETAENSVAAQQKAFDAAQVKAFEALAQRMTQASAAKQMPTPDIMTISAMIKDFEVTNEQVSSVRYVGTYTFRFRESDVTEYFSVSGVSYNATASDPLLVLPFIYQGGKNVLWAEGNVWLAAWSRAKLPPALVPVEIPIGDLLDVGDINDAQGLNYDVARLNEMLKRYGATEAAIMIASPDVGLMNVASDAAVAAGTLQISIYRTDLGAPQFVQELSVTADGTETRAQLYDRAVASGYQVLQSDWKTKTVSSVAQTAGYQVRIPLKSLGDWVRIQKILRNVPGVNDVDVVALTPREARANLNFRGDLAHLRDMLGQYGMGVDDGAGSTSGAIVYNLLLDVPTRNESFYTPPEGNNAPAAGPTTEPAAAEEDMIHTF